MTKILRSRSLGLNEPAKPMGWHVQCRKLHLLQVRLDSQQICTLEWLASREPRGSWAGGALETKGGARLLEACANSHH